MTQSVARRLHHPLAGLEPGAGEFVIGGEARELVPIVVDRVDLGIVGPLQVALELQVVGRVGEDEIDRMLGKFFERGDAIADQNTIEKLFGSFSAGKRGARRGAPIRVTGMTGTGLLVTQRELTGAV